MDETVKDTAQLRRVVRPKKVAFSDKADTFKEHADAVINQITKECVADMATIELHAAAQGLALRIWNGQSPDLLRPERIARVQRGLEAQGMSMEGVELP